MTPDKGLCCAIIAEKRIQPVLEAGINPDDLHGEPSSILRKIINHYLTYQVLPDKDALFIGITFEEPTQPLEVFIEEIRRRSLRNKIKNGMKEVRDLLLEDAPDSALESIQKLSLELNDKVDGGKIDNIFSDESIAEFKSEYNRRKELKGPDGICTNIWPSIDWRCYGFQPQQVIVIVGKKKTMKTFVALALAYEAWKSGHLPVLLVSPEMSKHEIRQRVMALHTKVSYEELTQGRLSAFEEAAAMNKIETLADAPGLAVAEFGQIGSTYQLDVVCSQMKPKFVLVDGLYILEPRSKFRAEHERVASVVKDLKKIAARHNLTILSTTQFNRQVKYGKTDATTDEIAACVHANTLIYTDNGIARISDIVGKEISIFDGESFEEAKIVSAGLKQECVVSFDDGSTITCSPDHRFWVQSKTTQFNWKRAQELEADDTCLVFGSYEFGEDDLTIEHDRPGRVKVTEPTTISSDLAECMGMLVGNGAVCQRNTWSLTLCGYDEDVAARFTQIIKNEFDYECRRAPHDGHNRISIRLHSVNLISYLTEMGMPRCRSHSKYIPSAILRGSPQIRGAFLRGLFETDGSCTDRDLRFGSTSEQLAREAQILLRSLGIHSNMMKKYRKAGTSYWPMYYLRVPVSVWPRFQSLVGFASDRKQQILANGVRRDRHEVPNYIRPLKNHLSVMNVTSIKVLDTFSNMYDVVKRGGKHRFLANGIVVHNSDAVGQFADAIFGLFAPKKTESRGPTAIISTLAARWFRPVKILIKCDLVGMDFSEIAIFNDDGEVIGGSNTVKGVPTVSNDEVGDDLDLNISSDSEEVDF